MVGRPVQPRYFLLVTKGRWNGVMLLMVMLGYGMVFMPLSIYWVLRSLLL